MKNAELNNDQIATAAGNVTVYNYDGDTREYLSSSVEYLVAGVGLPANSCIDVPGISKDGFAICRTADLDTWEYVTDHRGETVYCIKTGETLVVSLPGNYPKDATTLAPATPYDTWNGSEWITDTEELHAAEVIAAERQKAAMLVEAKAAISLWQTELQLDIISVKDKASLIEWLAYIKLLQTVDTDTAPGINWPLIPSHK